MTPKKNALREQKKQSNDHIKTGYKGIDSRKGRLHEVKTSHGTFRMKDNRKED